MGRKRAQLTIGQQLWAMRAHFPNFDYQRTGNKPTWNGTLQPFPTSPPYGVRITYSMPTAPSVSIVFPELRADAPHLYPDGSLCLYYPLDFSWTPDKLIACTIVPWTALWLAFYELWLETGQWHGPEAPHEGRKHR